MEDSIITKVIGMEDGRDSSMENVEQDPEDFSLNLSDDTNLSSDSEQDKVQRSFTDVGGLSGRSTAEPPSTTSFLSDESGSTALDDSLAEEDAVLKNNLELMSDNEDMCGPLNASKDLQLSSDSSSASVDLNSSIKSENDGCSSKCASDVISQINNCLDSLCTSNSVIDTKDDKSVESESQRTNSAESGDCISVSKDDDDCAMASPKTPTETSSKAEEAEAEANSISEEPNTETQGPSSVISTEEEERLCTSVQEGSNQDVNELDSHPTFEIESPQPSIPSENSRNCDAQETIVKELSEVPVSGCLPVCSTVSNNVNLSEDVCGNVSENEENMLSAETALNSDNANVRYQENEYFGISEGGSNPENVDSDLLNSTPDFTEDISLEQNASNSSEKIQDKSDIGQTDVFSDAQDEVSSDEVNNRENSGCGSFTHLNGGLNESMDCDDLSLSGTSQVVTPHSSAEKCTKPVVTSNALNAAWKKAFANTAKKYEGPAPEETHISWKSPDVEETSNTNSSDISSNESHEDEDEEDGNAKKCHIDVESRILVEEDSSRPMTDVAQDFTPTSDCLASSGTVDSVSPIKDSLEQLAPQVLEQAPDPQSSIDQLSHKNAEKSNVGPHPLVSIPEKRLFGSSQVLSGTHVNMANPVPEYPQYLGVQPTVKFKCVRCGVKGFTSMMELKTHQLSCLKNLSPAPQAHQVSGNPSASTNFRITRKVYLCSACGTYYENWNLFLHMREVHKRHICLFCLGMFSQAEKLSFHLISKHKVTESHYLSPEDFKCSYKGSCFLMCCTCEKMFTEDNFTNHLCRGDLVVCAVCGGEGVHLPSCQLSSSRKQVTSQPKRSQLTCVPETSKSNLAGSEKIAYHRIEGALESKRQSNYRGGKTGKKSSGSLKSKQILKVKIPIKPPVSQVDSYSSATQSHSKRSNTLVSFSDSSSRPALLQDAVPSSSDTKSGSFSTSNLDKTINAVALGITDEAREWEERMEAERKRIEEARQIYTDSGEGSDGAYEEDELLQPGSTDEETEGNDNVDEELLISSEKENVASEPPDDDPQVAENEILTQPVETALEEIQTAVVEPEKGLSDEKEARDSEDSDSEKLSLVVDENQTTSGDERAAPKSDSVLQNYTASPPPSPLQPSLPPLSPHATILKHDVPLEISSDINTSGSQENIQENSHEGENLSVDKLPPEEIPMDEEPFEETPVDAVDVSLTETHQVGSGIDDIFSNVPDSNIETENNAVSSEVPEVEERVEERSENRLIEGYTLAGVDVPETELSLDKHLHIMKTQEVLKECVRTLCWSCVYCSHAKKIAVNGKQLALHVLSEHRIVPIDGSQNEIPSAERFIVKLKEALDSLQTMHFNTDSYDSTDVANSLPYDRSYECFHCHFYTRLHKELYIHNRKMHQKTILLCIMCKSNFYSYSELLCHLCPGIYIPQCNVTFRCCMCNVDELPSAFRLMVHLRKRHHACDVCLETTDDQQKLSNHVWKHKLHHLCYRCGIAYRNKPDITKHLFWKHGTESVLCKKCLQKKWPHVYHFCVPPPSFVCEECSATFARAVSLRVHKRLHSDDFRYPCPECEDKFISKKLLAKHKIKHEIPAPVVIDDLPGEKENDFPKPDTNVPPAPKETNEDIRPKSPEDKTMSGVTSPAEKKHVKKKKHKRDEQEGIEEKQKKSVDVFDLPPLNLSSESDSSEDEGKKESVEDVPMPSQDPQTPRSSPSVAVEDKMEVEEPAPVIDGIWDKFQNFQASLEKRDALDDPEQFVRKTIMMDHDYCLPPGKPPGAAPGEDSHQPSEVAPPGVVDTPENVDASGTPKSSPVKRKKTPKKRERQSSGRASSSSSSDSSSDSDSSSCSCGSNCSCSSSSSSSSGSSSSSSDSDDSSSSEGKGNSKKERQKEKADKEREDEKDISAQPEEGNILPAVEEPHIDVLDAEPTIRESDLDTTETDTDEDFYDDNPQKLANELLQEKRNLMLLAAVAPINNGGASPTQSSSSQPPTTVPSEPPPVKRKGKKRRKRQFTSSRQNKSSHSQPALPSQVIPPPSESQFPSYCDQVNIPDANVAPSAQQYTSSIFYTPQTAILPPSSPGVGSPLSQASHSAVSKVKRGPCSKIHDYSSQSVGSGSETEGRTKRKRMRNRFYGFGSDEDEENTQQANNKVRKSGISGSYQTAQEPIIQPTMPPLTIKKSQVQPPPSGPFYHSQLPSSTWSTNLIPSVKSDSDNDSDVHQVSQANASSSSDTDSDDDAMQIAESPPPPQFEAPRTGENKDNLYCYCQCPYDEVSEMIACDGVDCRIEWFHFECVGIMVPPKGQWYCPDCRRRMSGGQDYMLN